MPGVISGHHGGTDRSVHARATIPGPVQGVDRRRSGPLIHRWTRARGWPAATGSRFVLALGAAAPTTGPGRAGGITVTGGRLGDHRRSGVAERSGHRSARLTGRGLALSHA